MIRRNSYFALTVFALFFTARVLLGQEVPTPTPSHDSVVVVDMWGQLITASNAIVVALTPLVVGLIRTKVLTKLPRMVVWALPTLIVGPLLALITQAVANMGQVNSLKSLLMGTLLGAGGLVLREGFNTKAQHGWTGTGEPGIVR